MHFPSQEWADAYRAALNTNAAYQEAARAWEGDILLVVKPANASDPAPGIHLALAHGSCSAATFHPDARTLASEFVYEGPTESWQRLFRHEVDPVKAIVGGTFKVRGNLAKLMRFTRAAKELVETAGRVPSDP